MLRLWIGFADTTCDVAYSERILEKVAADYNKMRLVLRMLSANLYDFTSSTNTWVWADLRPIDRFIILKANQMVSLCEQDMNHFCFHAAIHRILSFFHEELSTFYLGSIKDRLYCDHAQSRNRRSAQIAMIHLLRKLTQSLQPFAPFLCHEVSQSLDLDSLTSPEFLQDKSEAQLETLIHFLRDARSILWNKFDNDARLLEKMDVKFLVPNKKSFNVFSELLGMSTECLREMLACRNVDVVEDTDSKGDISPSNICVLDFNDADCNYIKIDCDRNEVFFKCPRCRRFLSDEIDQICSRCDSVLKFDQIDE